MKIGRFMRRFRKQFRYGEKGFTLIELLVVIGILGILAAIVVPNFATFFGRGQTEADEMEMAMVKTATMAFAADTGACPANIGALDDYFENPADVRCSYTWDTWLNGCQVLTQTCP